MSSDENNVERIDQPKETADKPALNEKEGTEVQEKAADQAGERRRFLESSFGKNRSPSTAMIAMIVPEIYDGVKKIVGFFTGERPKIDLEISGKGIVGPKEDDPLSRIKPEDIVQPGVLGILQNPSEQYMHELKPEDIGGVKADDPRRIKPDDIGQPGILDQMKSVLEAGKELFGVEEARRHEPGEVAGLKEAPKQEGVFLEIDQLSSLILAKSGSDMGAAAAKPGKDAGDDAGKKAEDAGKGKGEQAEKKDTPQEGLKEAPKQPPVDTAKVDPKMSASVEAVHGALHGLWRSDTDYEQVNKIFQNMNQKEREDLKDLYAKKYGIKLEEEFSKHDGDAQQDKALNLLNRKDGKAGDAARDAGLIHTALVERGQWVEGRSDENCEKDIRDTISSLNSKQIEELDKEYQAKYGKSLRETLKDDPHLSQKTKDALDTYLKGTDHRDQVYDDKTKQWMPDPNFSDTKKLAEQALNSKDTEMFQEAMSRASADARKDFMANGGDEKMAKAFLGDTTSQLKNGLLSLAGLGNPTENITKWMHARDYATEGKLSTSSKILDNWRPSGDNEKAIEQAIHDMPDEERRAFVHGKELAASGKDKESLSEADKKDLKSYEQLHYVLGCPGNEAEVRRWEDMIAHKDGSLVAKIAGHTGTLYSDSAADVRRDVENMSKQDWEYAKTHPEYRAEVEKALKGLGGVRVDDKDVAKMMAAFDEKMKAGSYEESLGKGNRSFLEKVEDSKHWYQNDRKAILDDIMHMTLEEQKKYRDGAEFEKKGDQMTPQEQEAVDFKKKVDDAVKEAFKGNMADALAAADPRYFQAHPELAESNPGMKAAQQLLDKIGKGEKPEPDLITKLNMDAQERLEERIKLGVLTQGAGTTPSDFKMDVKEKIFGAGTTAKFVADMQEEFEKDPKLRERILHPDPKSPEDKKLSEEFYKAAELTMDKADMDKYVKPLLENGKLPAEVQMQLYKGATSGLNDLQGTLQEVAKLSPEEKQKILKDKDYQEKTLGYLSAEDRKVALNVLEQGKELPEDKLRAKINHWGGKDDVMESLRAMKDDPAAIEKLKQDYARKYGHDLTADLIDKLSGEKRNEAENILRRAATSSREGYADDREQVYKSYDGFGKRYIDGVWDGTGHMTEDAKNKYVKEMAEASAHFKDLPPERQKELKENLNKAISQFVESKGNAADAVVNVAIAAAAIVGAAVTDGASLAILATLSGATLKPLLKAIINGADYDWSGAGITKDVLTGALEGFVNAVGPGEIGKVLRVGEVAAEAAAKQAMKQIGKEALKEGAEAVIKAELKTAVREAIVHGAPKVGDEVIAKIAAQAVKEGASDAEKAAVKAVLKKELESALKTESKSLLDKAARQATKMGLEGAAGATGGAMTGAVDGVANWDGTKTFDENMKRIGESMAMGAASGAAGAVVMSGVLKAGSEGWKAIAEHFHVKPGEKLPPAAVAELEKKTGLKVTQAEDGIHFTKPGEKPASGVGDKHIEAPPEKQFHKPADAAGKPREVVPDRLDERQNGIKDGEVIGKSTKDAPPGRTNATKKSTLEVLERVPADHQFQPGERVMAGGERGHVLGSTGDMVVVGHPSGEVAGKGIPEGQYDLKKLQKIEAGEQTYYKSENGEYYRLNKNKELVLDSDVKAVPREKIDGVVHDVVFHDLSPGQDGKVRMRKELAAYKLNEMVGFDNGFPVTTPKEVNGVHGFAQEHAGNKLEKDLPKLAQERYPVSEHPELYKNGKNAEAVSKLLREDPELRKAVEEAYLERILMGDTDPNSGNFVISKDANGKYKVQSIDLDDAFSTNPHPEMAGDRTKGLSNQIFFDLSEKPISPEFREKIAKFVQKYDTAEGRQQLIKTGLKPDETDAYLARARELADTGKFPRARCEADYFDPVEKGTRHGKEVVTETYNDNVILHNDVDQPKLDFKPVSEKELAAYKQIHGSDIFQGEDGKYYRVRKSADGKTVEIARDPSLRDMKRSEFNELVEQAAADEEPEPVTVKRAAR